MDGISIAKGKEYWCELTFYLASDDLNDKSIMKNGNDQQSSVNNGLDLIALKS